MKNLNPIQTKGYFWLPENPDEKLPGELKISENGRVELKLMGIFTNSEWTGSGPIEKMFRNTDTVDRICGQIYEGGFVTLLECLSTNRTLLPFSKNGLNSSSFLAHRALIGVPYENDDLLFSELDFVVEGLDDWLSTDTIKTAIRVESEDDIIKSFLGGTIEYGPKESSKYNLKDGTRMQFCSLVSGPALSPSLPLTSVTLTSQSSISLVSNEPRDIDYFLTLAARIQKFIALAVDQEVHVQSFTFHEKRSDYPIPVRLYLQMNLVPNSEYKPEILKVLFSLTHIENSFEEMIGRWVEYYDSDEVGHALNLYFAGAWKEGAFLESNFIFFAQALEILNRQLCPTSKPMDPKRYNEVKKELLATLPSDTPQIIRSRIGQNNEPSLRDRAKDMMESFEDWFGDNETSEEFAKRISEMRNFFTHYSRASERNKLKGRELYDLTIKLEILVLLHILTFIGFNKDQIVQIVDRSRRLSEELPISSMTLSGFLPPLKLPLNDDIARRLFELFVADITLKYKLASHSTAREHLAKLTEEKDEELRQAQLENLIQLHLPTWNQEEITQTQQTLSQLDQNWRKQLGNWLDNDRLGLEDPMLNQALREALIDDSRVLDHIKDLAQGLLNLFSSEVDSSNRTESG